jgi:hypothetical protein
MRMRKEKLEILRIIHHERRLTFQKHYKEPKYELLAEWIRESINWPRMIIISFLAEKIEELNKRVSSQFVENWTPCRDVEIKCNSCGEVEFFYYPEEDAWCYKTRRQIYYWKVQHLKQHLK